MLWNSLELSKNVKEIIFEGIWDELEPKRSFQAQ